VTTPETSRLETTPSGTESTASGATSTPPGPGCAAAGDPDGLLPLTATTMCADPQRVYARLRERHGTVAPVELEPGVNGWLVLGYREILAVSRQEQLFAVDPRNWADYANEVVAPDSGLGPLMFPRDNAYFSDGERHRRLRTPLEDGLAGIDQRAMRRSVEQMCTDLIAGFAGRGTADLVGEYAAIVPMLAVADLFGIDADQGYRLLLGLTALFGSGDDAHAADRRFEEIIVGIVRDRRAVPADDLTTSFLDHPNLENDYEVIQSMALMLAAGLEVTTTWIAQTLRLMLTDARFGGRLRGGRLGVDDALDEVLWRDPPMANMPARYALRDTELGGRRIRKGDALVLAFSAANNDPAMHAGDRWTELGNRAHLAWSSGPHACPARTQARIVTRTAVETVTHRLPGVRLTVPPEQLAQRPSPWMRCPASLPVRFDPPLLPKITSAAERRL
jgi:cytochrome P450